MSMSVPKDTSYTFRLFPGADLRNSIQSFVKEGNIQAGWIVSCAGSLTRYSIRFANQKGATKDTGHFEIVSLTGTVSANGSHLHISISDSAGKTIGGHLMEGCKIYTTAEIVLVESGEYIFKREKDGSTSWKELQVVKK
jgi:predicted DNA-binding protein with PD1-like motif